MDGTRRTVMALPVAASTTVSPGRCPSDEDMTRRSTAVCLVGAVVLSSIVACAPRAVSLPPALGSSAPASAAGLGAGPPVGASATGGGLRATIRLSHSRYPRFTLVRASVDLAAAGGKSVSVYRFPGPPPQAVVQLSPLGPQGPTPPPWPYVGMNGLRQLIEVTIRPGHPFRTWAIGYLATPKLI